jgi:hypothetical protein
MKANLHRLLGKKPAVLANMPKQARNWPDADRFFEDG